LPEKKELWDNLRLIIAIRRIVVEESFETVTTGENVRRVCRREMERAEEFPQRLLWIVLYRQTNLLIWDQLL